MVSGKTKGVTKEKRKKRRIDTQYSVEKEKLVRLHPFCERCGPGYFMADHSDRYTCGHCGFTKYKRSKTSK